MKTKMLITAILLILFFGNTLAQMGPGPRYGRARRLRQLEQLKLIEFLNLDEKTSR